MNVSRISRSTHGIEIDIQRAERRNDCVRALTDLYQIRKYRPYALPLIDSYDGYVHLLDAENIQRSFRFTNSAGELVLLRPDLTLFLARHAAHTLQASDLPLRLYYNDSVVRDHQYSEGGGQLEQHQSGVELIGNTAIKYSGISDERNNTSIELLTLLKDSLNTLGLGQSVIHIGSRKLIRHAIEHIACQSTHSSQHSNPTDRIYDSLIPVIHHRRKEELATLLKRYFKHKQKEIEEYASFLLHIGDAPPPLPNIGQNKYTDTLKKELDCLKELASVSAKRGLTHIRIDLSEIGNQDYYSGFTFAAYHPQANEKIASGGHYDTLFAKYGFDVPAAGFTFFLDRCEDYVTINNNVIDNGLQSTNTRGTQRK